MVSTSLIDRRSHDRAKRVHDGRAPARAPDVDAVRRWGLLDQVIASGCPPVETYSFDFGPFTIKGSPRPVDGQSAGYSPRRTVLDKILVDAAASAGAEVRERFTVDEV